MRIVLLGEQATGKSSLLVALYGALVNHHAGALRLVRTVDEVEFLSRGLHALGRQESVQRTDLDSEARLLVELVRGEELVSVEVPDRSGELVKHMLDARVWEPELHRQIGRADGAMLFLRADLDLDGEEADPRGFAPALDPTGAEPRASEAEPLPAEEEPLGDDAEPETWTPALMPPDARTVDLLQAVLDAHEGPLPLALVLSAWDRVGRPGRPPAAWLAQRMPLLDQFLATQGPRLPHAVFGVSAQGGDFAVGLPAELVVEDPWDRAFAVRPDEARGTLSDPLLWLLDAAA